MGEVGLFIEGIRPTSKKAVKEAVAAGKEIFVEGTSFFPGSDSYASGPLAEVMKSGKTLVFVGPDPYKKRNFFGQIKMVGGKLKVT